MKQKNKNISYKGLLMDWFRKVTYILPIQDQLSLGRTSLKGLVHVALVANHVPFHLQPLLLLFTACSLTLQTFVARV